IVPEVEEDLWHAYNLIAPHDHVQSTTFRKVQKETGGGGSESERIKLRLEVTVEEVDFDASAHVIRVRGKNITENEHVKLGSYHTLELDLQRAFTLTKDVRDSVAIDRLKEAWGECKDVWDSVALDRLKEACGECKDVWDSVALDRLKEACAPVLCEPVVVLGSYLVPLPRRPPLRLPYLHPPSRPFLVSPHPFHIPLFGFSNADVKTRRRYVDLVESVRANGSQVYVFFPPSLPPLPSPPITTPHLVPQQCGCEDEAALCGSSGVELVNLAGIAAILRFPLPELDDMEP
ncbi:unnamed protein product, partial [Closterium sp. NIES-65]